MAKRSPIPPPNLGHAPSGPCDPTASEHQPPAAPKAQEPPPAATKETLCSRESEANASAAYVPPLRNDQPLSTDIPKPAVIVRFAGIEVPRRFLGWCRSAIHYELLLLDWKPSTEPLLPRLGSP